jgi:hypothetical protein
VLTAAFFFVLPPAVSWTMTMISTNAATAMPALRAERSLRRRRSAASRASRAIRAFSFLR